MLRIYWSCLPACPAGRALRHPPHLFGHSGAVRRSATELVRLVGQQVYQQKANVVVVATSAIGAGVTLPEVGAVAVVDGPVTVADLLQQLGRARASAEGLPRFGLWLRRPEAHARFLATLLTEERSELVARRLASFRTLAQHARRADLAAALEAYFSPSARVESADGLGGPRDLATSVEPATARVVDEDDEDDDSTPSMPQHREERRSPPRITPRQPGLDAMFAPVPRRVNESALRLGNASLETGGAIGAHPSREADLLILRELLRRLGDPHQCAFCGRADCPVAFTGTYSSSSPTLSGRVQSSNAGECPAIQRVLPAREILVRGQRGTLRCPLCIQGFFTFDERRAHAIVCRQRCNDAAARARLRAQFVCGQCWLSDTRRPRALHAGASAGGGGGWLVGRGPVVWSPETGLPHPCEQFPSASARSSQHLRAYQQRVRCLLKLGGFFLGNPEQTPLRVEREEEGEWLPAESCLLRWLRHSTQHLQFVSFSSFGPLPGGSFI